MKEGPLTLVALCVRKNEFLCTQNAFTLIQTHFSSYMGRTNISFHLPEPCVRVVYGSSVLNLDTMSVIIIARLSLYMEVNIMFQVETRTPFRVHPEMMQAFGAHFQKQSAKA